MIRLFLAAFTVIAFLICFIPCCILGWLLQKLHVKWADIVCLRLVQGSFLLITFWTGSKITFIGKDKIPSDRPVLFTGNHRGFFDIVITYAHCKYVTGYVAKESMTKVPLLSSWMRRLYCLFMNREDPREGMKTIQKGTEYLKNGISICIFPEGTRNTTEELTLPFKEGSFRMAVKSGAPVVPLAITGTSAIFEDHLPKIKKSRVIIEYCDPIYMEDLSRDEQKHLGKRTQEIINQKLLEHQEMIKKEQAQK